MHISFGLTGLKSLPPAAILSIGNFDGLHLGHQRIIRQMHELAALATPATPLAIVTFEPHPLTVLRPGHAPPRLMSAQSKNALSPTHDRTVDLQIAAHLVYFRRGSFRI